MVGLGLTYNTLASMKESRTNRGSVPRSSLMELFRTLGFQLGVPSILQKEIFHCSAAAGAGLGDQPGVQLQRVQDIAAAATGAIVGEQFQATFDQLTQQEKNEVVKVEMFRVVRIISLLV